jgi:Sec-independent protein translocase protein TatA
MLLIVICVVVVLFGRALAPAIATIAVSPG